VADRERARQRTMNDDNRALGICTWCIHRAAESATCAAYPDGIPSEFIRGKAHHIELRGDEAKQVSWEYNGVQVGILAPAVLYELVPREKIAPWIRAQEGLHEV
jgi:hypothetical protein